MAIKNRSKAAFALLPLYRIEIRYQYVGWAGMMIAAMM